jgi:hypothetical protein
VIAVGNPAKVIKQLDPDKEIITRKDRYADTEKATQFLNASERESLEGNTLWGWIRSCLFPKKEKC